MAREVPYEHKYEVVESLNRTADVTLYLSVGLSLGILVLTKKWVLFYNETLIRVFTRLSVLLSIAYFILDIVSNYLFQSAEDCRRKDLIDHSVNTQLADQESNEYFTNDHVQPGIYKLGVNSFESCFFSCKISERMLAKSIVKVAMATVIIVAAVLWADVDLVVTILQMALPFTIIQQFVRLSYYRQRLNRIYDNFITIFQSPAGGCQADLLLYNSMAYDAAHAWASIKLPTKIYEKMNPQLTPAWTKLKKRLHI